MPRTHELDRSSHTILSKGAAGAVPSSTLRRHLPILRGCLGPHHEALFVADCTRSDRPLRRGRGSLLLLTSHRLVVTSESLLRRPRLYLSVTFNQLADVAWTAEPEWGGVYLAATAVDGVREHFWIRLGTVDRVWRMDAMLRETFTAPARGSRPQRPHHPARPTRLGRAGWLPEAARASLEHRHETVAIPASA